MAKLMYEHGLPNDYARMDYSLEMRITMRTVNYVHTTDGEIFFNTHIYNDKISPCYKIVTLTNGEKRNVNMNNGIAYRL